MVSMKKTVALLLAAIMLVMAFAGCKTENETLLSEDSALSDFSNAKIGVVTGTVPAIILPDMLPDAEYIQYTSFTDAAIALESGKVDAFPVEEAVCWAMGWEGLYFDTTKEKIVPVEAGIVFGKGLNPKLQEEFNAFLKDYSESGKLAALHEKWISPTEPEDIIEYESITGSKGTIKVAISGVQKPFTYIKNGRFAGHDIDMISDFAREYDYTLEFHEVGFAAFISGVTTGNYDMGASGLVITEERKESLDFSDPYYSGGFVFAIPKSGNEAERTLEDFENATLGVIVGSIYDGYSREFFPNAAIDSYQTFADLFQCVKQGKIDGFLLDIPNLNAVKRTDPGLSHIEIPGCYVDIGYAFGKDDKGEKLQSQMNEFIAELKENGTYDVLFEKWCGEKEPVGALKAPEYPETNEKLKICLDVSRKPYVYLLENEFAGLEVEIMYLFCEKYGYAPEFESAQWTSGVAGLKEGKYDVVSCGIYITEERKESVNFCDPYISPDVVMVIYEGTEESDFFAGLAESFEKTFIREDRWKLIAQGVITTVVISFFSVLFGTAFGFGLYMLIRSRNKAVSNITKVIFKIYSKILAGTPILVILMILFYVIFGKTDISGAVVSVIAFTLLFGSFVCGHLAITVDSIDKGQIEAALALGYSRNQAFFRIVLPQALKIFMPTFIGETVGLIKGTSVVGYITVNDLTKMGDIIRSNTYEAFFPLIATAVIYFIITWIAADLLGIIAKKFDPKKRKPENILKGVAK